MLMKMRLLNTFKQKDSKNMELNITLSEALERASEGLRKKMLHSVELLQKAEKIALNYDAK